MAVDHGYQYSVEVKSRFALFMNDGDENQAPVNHAEPAKTEIKSPETAQMKDKSQPLRMNKNERQTESAGRGRGRGSSAGVAKGAGRGSRGPSQRGGMSRAGNESSEFATNDETKKDDRPPRGGGHRGGRGGRGGGIGGRQREFDRHSGSDKTGVKAMPKKDGHGTGNWGTVDDEIDATMSTVNEVADEVNTSQAVEPEAEEVGPPEPEHLTLEEYRALKKERDQHLVASTQPGRKPNDGKDVFKNMVVHEPVKATKEHHEAPSKPHQPTSTMENIGISFKVVDNLGTSGKGPRPAFKSAAAGPQASQAGGERRGGRGGSGLSARGGRGAPRGAPGGTGPRPVSRGAGRGAGPAATAAVAGPANSRGGAGAPPPSITSNKDFPSLS